MSTFKKAEKKKSKLRLGISGPSGSGKTFSALRMAKGMCLKTAVIDSEKGSASLYADKFDFEVLEISPPYSTEKYQEALKLAEKEGFELVIIDSISHAWSGEGGLLNQKEQLDARGGNSFANWAKMTPKQEKFINAIVSSQLHVIVTMRSKQDYSISDDNGKKKIQKVGLAPVQREGFEYELTTVFDVAMNHECETSKDRTSLFVDKIFKITEKTGETLIEWLNSGKELINNVPPTLAPIINKEIIENLSPVITEEEMNLIKLPEKENSYIVYYEEDDRQPAGDKSLGIYTMVGGKYAGLTLNKLKELDLKKYVQQCEFHASETKRPLPLEVQENIFTIKKYLGIN